MNEYIEATIITHARAKGIRDFTSKAARYFDCEPSELETGVVSVAPILSSDSLSTRVTHVIGYRMRLRAWKEAS